MIKTCRCGKEYEAGIGIMTLPVCPDCADEWDAEIEAKEKALNIEAPIDEQVLLDKLGIRPRHYGCTFENFTARNPEEQTALSACKRMAETKRGIIALIGNNGTGKTHLACSTVRAIGSGRLFKMIEIGMFIRKYINSDTLDEQGQLDYLIRLPFLGIDETEKSKQTDAEIKWLSYIIDERNERYRPTMLISNCHPRAIHKDGAPCDKCFESIMTPDILDRISQYGVIKYFDGESHRREMRGKE